MTTFTLEHAVAVVPPVPVPAGLLQQLATVVGEMDIIVGRLLDRRSRIFGYSPTAAVPSPPHAPQLSLPDALMHLGDIAAKLSELDYDLAKIA